MFSTLKNAFKDKDIRSKIFFTLFILLLYRIGANITVPGVNAKAITRVAQTGLVPMLDTVSGGGAVADCEQILEYKCRFSDAGFATD